MTKITTQAACSLAPLTLFPCQMCSSKLAEEDQQPGSGAPAGEAGSTSAAPCLALILISEPLYPNCPWRPGTAVPDSRHQEGTREASAAGAEADDGSGDLLPHRCLVVSDFLNILTPPAILGGRSHIPDDNMKDGAAAGGGP